MGSANRPSPHTSGLDNETPVPAMAAPASPCRVVDTGPDGVVKESTKIEQVTSNATATSYGGRAARHTRPMSLKVRREISIDLMTLAYTRGRR
jgi:hypothetical protein